MFTRLLALFALILLLSSCSKQVQPKEQKPTVLVSVPPYAYFVKKIAQDKVQIETLVPIGANPHIYEPSPKEVQRHQTAALWVYLGEAFDKKVLQFFKDTHHPIHILDIAKDLDLLSICEEDGLETETHHCHHSHAEGYDLHVWLNPILAKQQVKKIAAALSELIPDQQQLFSENLQTLLKELDALDHQIRHILNPFHGKAILVSHPAFGYFCKEYHLVQLSIEIEGKDPLPQHITEILQQAKRYSIQSILIEPQYSNKGAELMAQSLHLPTHMVDPYAENYSENLLAIAKVIAE